MEYRYILDSSSKKFRCRKCTKKTLVKFIDTKTNDLMTDEFGRCDRESKCGFFKIPKGFNNDKYEYKYIKPPRVSFHDYNLVSMSGKDYKNNNFILFVKSLFGSHATKKVIKKYLIGTSKKWQGATVFWQIDNNQNVRHGKIMLYNSTTGKRKKNALDKPYISSARSVLNLKNFVLKQCLFGLHLINESVSKSLAVVESEKTAILMSLFKPQYIWLATGSKGGFKYEYLKPIRDYKIIAFPDKSEFTDWQNKAIELNSLGFSISVSQWLETTDYKKGTDLADILIKENLYNSPQTEIEKPNESSKPSISIVETSTEIIVKKLALKNPAIKNLINTFDLTDKNGIEIIV